MCGVEGIEPKYFQSFYSFALIQSAPLVSHSFKQLSIQQQKNNLKTTLLTQTKMQKNHQERGKEWMMIQHQNQLRLARMIDSCEHFTWDFLKNFAFFFLAVFFLHNSVQ